MTKKAATHPEKSEATETVVEAPPSQEKVESLIRRHVYWALGLGLVPIPLFDLVAITGIQVKMIKEISDLYQVKFTEEKAKTAVAALFAGITSLSLTSTIAGSLFKLVPVVGQLVGAVGVSAVGGALTKAIGNTFALHYASGGTLFDFDAAKMREHFRKDYEKAKGAVKNLVKEDKPAESATA